VDPKQERFVAIPVVLGICIAAVVGTATVLYQTTIANPTIGEYYSLFTVGRLLALTHVHMFGYATMGYLLWTIGRRQGVTRTNLFGVILGLAVIAGILDVLSWWGVVYLNPAFRFLTFVAGGAFVAGILLSALLVLLAFMRGGSGNQSR